MKWPVPPALVRRVKSLPVRGAWVEIFTAGVCKVGIRVAPRAGSVG